MQHATILLRRCMDMQLKRLFGPGCEEMASTGMARSLRTARQEKNSKRKHGDIKKAHPIDRWDESQGLLSDGIET